MSALEQLADVKKNDGHVAGCVENAEGLNMLPVQ
jgi:hypothetical protein